MNNIRIVSASVLTIVALAFGGASVSYADQLDDIHKLNKERTEAAKKSQARVDKLQDERQTLLEEYKQVNRIIEDLRVYNNQLSKTIKGQERVMSELDEAIAQAAAMKQRMTPLMMNMLDALQRFVALDMPFLEEERANRLDRLNDLLTDPTVDDSERFRLVLDAYSIESEYGRTTDVYDGIINIGDDPVNVNIMRIGRIALVAQTKDEQTTLAWDKEQGTWTTLPGSYRNPVRTGIRIVNGLTTKDIMMLPVPAPENAE